MINVLNCVYMKYQSVKQKEKKKKKEEGINDQS